MHIVHLEGLTPYSAAHDLQRACVEARGRGTIDDVLLMLEHSETITVGRQRDAARNVLLPSTIPVIQVERGGDVTWHGPGQLVAYPIVHLEGPKADLHRHLRALEQATIDLLSDMGLRADRDGRNTGVWLPIPDGDARKVCSIGIACRKWVTWHGLALNVDPDLHAFRRINPCGFHPEIMTRVSDHVDSCPTIDSLVVPLSSHLVRTLDLDPGPHHTLPADWVDDPTQVIDLLKE